jgi:hypothetical protein
VVITWSPGLKIPFRAMFKASVALAVKITFSGFSEPKKEAREVRHSNTFSAASMARR